MKYAVLTVLSFTALCNLAAAQEDCHPDWSTKSQMVCVSDKGAITVPSGSIAKIKDHKSEEKKEEASFEEPGNVKGQIHIERKHEDKSSGKKQYKISRITKRYDKDDLTETYSLWPKGGLRSYTICDQSSVLLFGNKDKCLTVNKLLCGYLEKVPNLMKEKIKQCKDAMEDVKRHTDLMSLLTKEEFEKDTGAVSKWNSSTSSHFKVEADTLQGMAETVHATSKAQELCAKLGSKLVAAEEKVEGKKKNSKKSEESTAREE